MVMYISPLAGKVSAAIYFLKVHSNPVGFVNTVYEENKC